MQRNKAVEPKPFDVSHWRQTITVLTVVNTVLLAAVAAALLIRPFLFALMVVIAYTVAGVPQIRRMFLETPEEKQAN